MIRREHVGLETDDDSDWIMSTLEYDQLVEAKKRRLPLRKLGGVELVVIWALRGYVVFMMAAVILQIIHGQ